MTLLIDCYNLLHVPMPPSLAGLDEAWLCRLLARSRYRSGGIVVVCDGVAKPGGPNESAVPEVDLVFSGPARSADDVIVALVHKHSAPRRLTVVSNDRQIQKAARRRRARISTCEQLVHELLHGDGDSSDRTDDGKPGPQTLSDEQVGYWSAQFGVDPQMPIDGD